MSLRGGRWTGQTHGLGRDAERNATTGAAERDAGGEDGEGPLFTALVEILNAERAEKARLKQDVETYSKELEHARNLHLATYQQLQSAEATIAKLTQEFQNQHHTDTHHTAAQVDKGRDFGGHLQAPPPRVATGGRAFASSSLRTPERTPGRLSYDNNLKLQSTGTPVIGTLTPSRERERQRTKSAGRGGGDEEDAKKTVRFMGNPIVFGSGVGAEGSRASSQKLASTSPFASIPASASVSPLLKGFYTPLASQTSRERERETPSGAGASCGQVAFVKPHSQALSAHTPSHDLLEHKWKERCLTAEYKQKMLEQQVSDLEQDVITMSLKLEDELDVKDQVLVKKFELRNIDKWQQYVLRKSLLLVRSLSRQVADAMKVVNTPKGTFDIGARLRGWQLLLQDMDLVVKCIHEAGIKPISGGGSKANKQRKGYEFDLEEKELRSFFQRCDYDEDGLLSFRELKELIDLLKDYANEKPKRLPAPIQLTLPPGEEENHSLGGFKLGVFYKELMSKHRKMKHFGKRKSIHVAKLNQLSTKLLKSVYYTYCTFGMGHGEERSQHSSVMDCNNFAKLCRECGIISQMPLGEADIFFAAVTEMYSRSLDFEEFLHALLMVSEESKQELEDIIRQVIDHGVPEIHVRTTKPMQPILKTASRPEVWKKKQDHGEEEEEEEKHGETSGGNGNGSGNKEAKNEQNQDSKASSAANTPGKKAKGRK